MHSLNLAESHPVEPVNLGNIAALVIFDKLLSTSACTYTYPL